MKFIWYKCLIWHTPPLLPSLVDLSLTSMPKVSGSGCLGWFTLGYGTFNFTGPLLLPKLQFFKNTRNLKIYHLASYFTFINLINYRLLQNIKFLAVKMHNPRNFHTKFQILNINKIHVFGRQKNSRDLFIGFQGIL